jgi:hypothetical protein
MGKTKVKFACDTVSVREAGSKYPTSVQKGSAWHADHPLVVGNPSLFTDDPPEVLPRGWKPEKVSEPVVEQASAAPGELRTARRPSNG